MGVAATLPELSERTLQNYNRFIGDCSHLKTTGKMTS